MVLESNPLPGQKRHDITSNISQENRPDRYESDRYRSQRYDSERSYAYSSYPTARPSVTIITPAYNEAAILERNLHTLYQYLQGLSSEYDWEVLIVNDGSRDQTGDLANAFARAHDNVFVIHHSRNQGLGQALKTGFAHSRGDYIIPLDLDLSYAPEHIEQLLDKIRQTGAKVVVTSPYMRGGQVSNVPWLRLVLSVWANRFLSFAARRNVSTLTGMVRVYDANFIKLLNLKSNGMEINPEVVHKAMLLGEPIEEIPAHLCWHKQERVAAPTTRRKSSMKILRHTWGIIYYGFVFRPVMFFIIPSLISFVLALYTLAWVLVRCAETYQQFTQQGQTPDFTDAIAAAFQQAPHTFMIGGILLMLSIQLFSLGILAVQNKRYFEEMFYLGSAIYRSSRSSGWQR